MNMTCAVNLWLYLIYITDTKLLKKKNGVYVTAENKWNDLADVLLDALGRDPVHFHW